jgi:hypothetical protein
MEYQLIKLNSARNSLRYVVKLLNIKEIYVPYYICPVVRTALSKENCKINFYNINLNFQPKQEFPKDAFVLYPNYFGICSDIVEELSLKYKNLIVDNAHSFFTEQNGIASFNSLRKFFNQVRDGSFLYIKSSSNLLFEEDNYVYNNEQMSEEEFILNENRLDYEEIKFISKTTNEYLNQINLDAEKQRIKAHFDFYHNKYGKENLLNLNVSVDDYPFKYPLLVSSEDRANEIVKELNNQGINVYRYWNNLPDSFDEKAFYERLICI